MTTNKQANIGPENQTDAPCSDTNNYVIFSPITNKTDFRPKNMVVTVKHGVLPRSTCTVWHTNSNHFIFLTQKPYKTQVYHWL